MGYSCAKFGDFSFSGFGLSCGQTDRQTDIRQNHAVELKTHTARALLKHVQHQLYMRCELKLCLHQGNMLPGNMLPVSRQHNYYSFMSRLTCIPLYPATNGQQTCNNFVAGNKQHVAGQHVALV